MFEGFRSATRLVAASDADVRSKIEADFVCDGTDDDVEIQAALDALPAAGGKIHLTDGVFNLSATVARAIGGVTFSGRGRGTKVNFNGSDPVIDAGTETGWVFEEFNTDAGDIGSFTDTMFHYWFDGVRVNHGSITEGAGIFMADFAVDGDYTGSDGDTITSSTGQTITIYKTIQGAVDAASNDDLIYILHAGNGLYNENVTMTSLDLHLMAWPRRGIGDAQTGTPLINGGAGGAAMTLIGCNTRLTGLVLSASGSNDALVVSSGTEVRLDYCDTLSDITMSGGAEIEMNDCWIWDRYNIASGQIADRGSFNHCSFGERAGTWDGDAYNHQFVDCIFYKGGATASDPIFALNNGIHEATFTGCRMYPNEGGSSTMFMVKNGTGRFHLLFTDCRFSDHFPSAGSPSALLVTATGANSFVSFENCSYRDVGGDNPAFIKSDDTDVRAIVSGCDLINNSQPAIVGSFTDSIFGPNHPPDFDINIDGGTGNVYYGTNTSLTGETGTVKSGFGDVTGDTASVDNEIVAFDSTTGKLIKSPNTENSAITHTLANASLVLLDATNDGNPFIRHGSSSTDALQTNIAYDAGAQTLNYVSFVTTTENGDPDKGEFRFNVDTIPVLTIDDEGLELAQGSIHVAEQAAAVDDIAAFGQFWVRDAVPNVPMFTDDTGVDLELGVERAITVQLTDAQVLTLATGAGVTIVPAPGTDLANIFVRGYLVADAAAGAWVEPSAPDDLVFQYADTVLVSAGMDGTPLVAADVSFTAVPALSVAEITPDVNATINLFNDGGQWTGGNVANSMSVRVWYYVVSTVAFS